MKTLRSFLLLGVTFTFIVNSALANNAFQIRSDGAHNTILQYKNTFTRGNNLKVTFKMWGDPGLVPLVADSWNGPAFGGIFFKAPVASDFFNTWDCEHII